VTVGSSGFFPVCLCTAGKRCLVVGGGKVGERKVKDALAAGYQVLLVSPDATPGLQRLAVAGEISWRVRPFCPRDLENVHLCFVATGGGGEEIALAARQAGVMVNVVDKPQLSDFVSPAVWRQGEITVAVSTSGASPALAAHIRDRVAGIVGPEAGEWAEILARFRQQIRKACPAGEKRRKLLRRAAALEGEAMLAGGQRAQLEAMLKEMLEEMAGEAVRDEG